MVEPTPRIRSTLLVGDILRRPGNIMVSEDVFHQRGITLLYRTSNVMIQSLFYGEICIFICTLYSSLYVLRHLCVAYPDFNIYNDVSYLISSGQITAIQPVRLM
jgi:hypothetical protein